MRKNCLTSVSHFQRAHPQHEPLTAMKQTTGTFSETCKISSLGFGDYDEFTYKLETERREKYGTQPT